MPNSPRKYDQRAKTLSPRATKRQLAELFGEPIEYPEDVRRPQTRAECQKQARPCPWVSCRYHLYLDVMRDGKSLKLNFPGVDPWELDHSCALDIADEGRHTLRSVGDLLNITRERVRQVDVVVQRKLRRLPIIKEFG